MDFSQSRFVNEFQKQNTRTQPQIFQPVRLKQLTKINRRKIRLRKSFIKKIAFFAVNKQIIYYLKTILIECIITYYYIYKL